MLAGAGVEIEDAAGIEDIVRVEGAFQPAHGGNLGAAAADRKIALLVKADAMFGSYRTAEARHAFMHGVDHRIGAIGLDDVMQIAVAKVAEAINRILADTFVLYLKTKNFHWHMSGKHFRDYHLLLDEHAEDIEATIDPLAERVRKLGAPTLHSFKEVLSLATLKESESEFLAPAEMFDRLIADNKAVAQSMREAHEICDEAGDVATASLLEEYIDHTERRLWFLFETNQLRDDDAS